MRVARAAWGVSKKCFLALTSQRLDRLGSYLVCGWRPLSRYFSIGHERGASARVHVHTSEVVTQSRWHVYSQNGCEQRGEICTLHRARVGDVLCQGPWWRCSQRACGTRLKSANLPHRVHMLKTGSKMVRNSPNMGAIPARYLDYHRSNRHGMNTDVHRN